MLISAVMTRDVKTLRADQPLIDAMQFLRKHHVRHIPVLDDQGALLGVLTDRDIKRATPSALAANQRDVWESIVNDTPLSRVMTREPTVADPTMDLRRALQLFVDENIGCLPVLEDNVLVGIVTASDMFKAMLTILEQTS